MTTTKQIYIATTIAGRGVKHVAAFDGRTDFCSYVDEVLSCHNVRVFQSDSIDTLCDKLFDNGFGFGSRSYRRVSRIEAKELITAGVDNVGCWQL